MTNVELVDVIRLAVREEVQGSMQILHKEMNERFTALEATQQTMNERLTSFEATQQTTNERLTSLEATQQTTNERLTSLEGTQQTTNEHLTSLEGTQQTTNEHLTSLEGTQQAMKGELDSVSLQMSRLAERMDGMEVEQKYIYKDIELALKKLDKVEKTVEQLSEDVKSLKDSQRTLEIKVDESIAADRRDMASIQEQFQTYAGECREAHLTLNRRLAAHEAQPDDRAHPPTTAA